MKKLFSLILALALLLPAVSLADKLYGEQPNTVFGKWTLYFDAREYNKTSAYPMDFDIQSLDLYIFENGSCYISTLEIKNGVLTPSSIVTGMWIGNDNEITMQFGNVTYKATATYGSLILHSMNSDFTLVHVYSIDPETYFDQ